MQFKFKLKYALLFTFLICSFSFFAHAGFISLSGSNKQSSNFDLIKRVTRATYLIQHNYYDAQRVHPEKMLQEGLFALSKKIPEMLVEFPEDRPNQFSISIGDQKKVIPLKKPEKIFDLFEPAAQAFSFIRSTYKGEVEADEQEYAFINGMLHTLDPHSNLLTPDVFTEFKTQTEGEYGGIGIVVGIKEEELTVIAPLEGTPAMKAGLKADDKIVQIDESPTINISLSEAVKKLRGKVNAKVNLVINRKNKDPFEVQIVRQKITIESIHSKLIKFQEKRIAFLRVRSFQEDTFADLDKALEKMKAEGPVDGIILDLRNNPGGLLDQSIMMADKFLENGDILFTVGANNTDEEVTKAQKGNDDLKTPMLVLVNQGSASASEIVAGAIKRNDRAAILGMKTFGKGSVQSLFNLRDGSAMKLTVAQYLTPQRISIQAVGITPDILLEPVTIVENEFDLKENETYGEKSLDEHLENVGLIKSSKPEFLLRFLEKEKKEEDSEYTFKVDQKKDFMLSLALKMLAKMSVSDRSTVIKESLPLLKQEAKQQDKKIAQELKALNIDWSTAGKEKNPPKLTISSQITDKKTGKPVTTLKAGNEILWTVTATNQGKGNVFRLLGVVKSENPVINEREFVFGRVKPGQTQKASLTLKIPEEIISFDEEVKIEFLSDNQIEIPPTLVSTHFVEKPKPQLVYSYEIFDNGSNKSKGNGNGIPEKGETITLDVSLKNSSDHEASKVTLNLKNGSKDGIRLNKGRIKLGKIEPRGEAHGKLSFTITDAFEEEDVKLSLLAYDKATRSGFSDDLIFSLVPNKEKRIDPSPKVVQATPKINLTKQEISPNGKVLHLSGTVEDDKSVKDIIIFSKGKKVFYKATPSKTPLSKLQFSTSIPLKEGANFISIQARDNHEFGSLKILSVMGASVNTIAKKSAQGETKPHSF